MKLLYSIAIGVWLVIGACALTSFHSKKERIFVGHVVMADYKANKQTHCVAAIAAKSFEEAEQIFKGEIYPRFANCFPMKETMFIQEIEDDEILRK